MTLPSGKPAASMPRAPADLFKTSAPAGRQSKHQRPVVPALPLSYTQRRPKPASPTPPASADHAASANRPSSSPRPVDHSGGYAPGDARDSHPAAPPGVDAVPLTEDQKLGKPGAARPAAAVAPNGRTGELPAARSGGHTAAAPTERRPSRQESTVNATSLRSPHSPNDALASPLGPPIYQHGPALSMSQPGGGYGSEAPPGLSHHFGYGPRMHHHHPSNSSMAFGGFYSTTPSPAPLNGVFPPPPAPYHHPVVPPPGLHLPYATEASSAMGLHEYGVASMAPRPLDGGYHMANGFDPATPHSFRGSQSSLVLEENPYTRHPPVNGQDGPDPNRYDLTGAHPGVHYQVPSSPPMLDMDNREDVLRVVRQGFANREFADCELHLHLADRPSAAAARPAGRRSPLVLPAHRLILARSPTLRNIMSTLGVPDGNVSVSSDDPYLRSDAFWFAIQTLYGFPRHELHADGPSFGGHGADKFELALGYAAAGSLLQVLPITAQGVRDAARLVSWATLGSAVDFAMAGATALYPASRDAACTQQFLTPQYKDGPLVHELMMAVATFIIDNFPSNFSLDRTAADPAHPRIPTPATLAAAASSDDGDGPFRGIPHAFAKGLQSPRPGSNPRLSSIKFGDLSLSRDNGSDGTAHNGVSDQTMSTLSSVLLNLPFDLVKLILESHERAQPSQWNASQDAHNVTHEVVGEREKRRLKAVEAVRTGRVPNAEAIRDRLASTEPRAAGDGWDALGWREEVSTENTDAPVLVRTWVPLT